MRIETNNVDVIFSTLIARKASEFEQKKNWTDGKEDGVKLVDGRPVFRTDLIALSHNKDGNLVMDNSITLAVLNPVDVAPAVQYRASGKIVVSPYLRNGRIAYSITAESIEPIKPTDK